MTAPRRAGMLLRHAYRLALTRRFGDRGGMRRPSSGRATARRSISSSSFVRTSATRRCSVERRFKVEWHCLGFITHQVIVNFRLESSPAIPSGFALPAERSQPYAVFALAGRVQPGRRGRRRHGVIRSRAMAGDAGRVANVPEGTLATPTLRTLIEPRPGFLRLGNHAAFCFARCRASWRPRAARIICAALPSAQPISRPKFASTIAASARAWCSSAISSGV
jgi:hypothetical protein